MTKILSELLAAKEPEFRQSVTRLERSSGQAHDIRLTSDLLAAGRQKLAELGLDPNDTAPEELYHALAEKVKSSDEVLVGSLGLTSPSGDILEGLVRAVKRETSGVKSFALKSSVARKVLKSHPPKKLQKILNYRSLDSMMKRESPASLLAAAKTTESTSWRRDLATGFKKLAPSEFETRAVIVEALTSQRWQNLANEFVASSRQNLLEDRVNGAVFLLPLELESYRAGMALAIFLLAQRATSDCLAVGNYLKMRQLEPGFGDEVSRAATSRIESETVVAGQKLDWRTFHNFMTSNAAEFELSPVLASEDRLAEPSDLLADVAPELEFWRGCNYLALLLDGQAVSLNPLDASLNYINHLEFRDRATHHFRANLWQELWRRYLASEVRLGELAASWRRELAGPELAPEFALAED